MPRYDVRLWFLLETLRCLDAKLRQKGSKLFVCVGSPDKVIPALVAHNNADLLTFERQTEPHNVARDKRVKDALGKMSVKVEYRSIRMEHSFKTLRHLET